MVYMILIYSQSSEKNTTTWADQKKLPLSSGRPAWRAFQTKATALRQTATASGWFRPALAAPFTRTAGGTTWKFCGNCIVIHSPAVNSEHPKIACALNMFKPVLPISWWDSLVLKVIPLRIFFFSTQDASEPLMTRTAAALARRGVLWWCRISLAPLNYAGTCRWDCR